MRGSPLSRAGWAASAVLGLFVVGWFWSARSQDAGGPGMDGPGMDGPGMGGPGMNGPGMDGPGMGGGPRGGGGRGFGGEEHTVTVGREQRSYTVHVPANVAKPAPVVFVFHGGGGRPRAIERRSGMDQLAEENGFIAVYPAGTGRGGRADDEDGGYPGGGGGGGRGDGGGWGGGGGGRLRGTWNIGGAKSPSAADDVAFVQAILTDLEKATPIDHARIYATGISMGGVFSYRLACEMSDTFAAIAPVAATMVEPACRPSSPVAVFHIHGAQDDRIPLKGGRGQRTADGRAWPAPKDGLVSWSKLDGCSGDPATRQDGPATCTTYGQCKATVEYCVVPEEGHNWPEGASERIWAFFKAHPKTAP